MLISRNLHMKSSKVSIKTRSTPASLSFKGQATKHTTVKWSIGTCDSEIQTTKLNTRYQIHTTAKQVISRRGKNKNAQKENRLCRACKRGVSQLGLLLKINCHKKIHTDRESFKANSIIKKIKKKKPFWTCVNVEPVRLLNALKNPLHRASISHTSPCSQPFLA